MKFTVYGIPKGKGRPKFTRQGNFVRAYTPKETLSYEQLVKFSYLEACNNNSQVLVGEVSMSIDAYFQIPKSTSKKLKKIMIEEEKYHIKKPDIDNIIKSILDGLNGVAFADDNQVCRIMATKRYAEVPRVEIEIRGELND
ncbi:MAG: RusA family crossover junction endodeoxyribonuclease [Bacilli bacterium]